MVGKRQSHPCYTALVLEALTACDDFMDYRMLERATGATPKQVSAACIHLRKRCAVDCIIEPSGVAWWYATPETDNRTRTVASVTYAERPRRRKARTAVTPARRSHEP